MRFASFSTTALILAGLLLLPGCGGKQGLQRYEVSGQITFEGKPVPKGSISFSPDKSKGNQGPRCNVMIVEGRFKTMAGRGTVGGPHIAKIQAQDGIGYEVYGGWEPDGRLLFPVREISVDLPKESEAVHDFNLTKE